MLFGIVLPVTAAETQENLVVLYTNDVHCSINGYPQLAAYRAQMIENGNKVITVDAGDAIQGEPIGTLTDGDTIVKIMNAVGYDYAIPGNHEYDYGMDVLLSIEENDADYKYISSNFVDLRTNSTVFEPYYIEDFNGEQIAFVGVTTPESMTKSTPAYFQDENGEYIYGFS